MVLVNCLWVGVLAGLVGSRLIRIGSTFAAPGSSVAVGVLGAMIGGLSRTRLLLGASQLPHADILAAGIGATIALLLWAAAQRYCGMRSSSR